MPTSFRIGLTRDFLSPEGKLTYKDMGLGILEVEPSIKHEFFARHENPMAPDQIRDFDAVISLAPKYTVDSFRGVDRLAAIFRFGVGYDTIDLKACTEANVACFITVGAVNYSVAEATISWMLALSHRMIAKDRLVREGRWTERVNYMGSELRGKTLGVVGVGGIGGKLIELLRAFGMNKPLAFDPYLKPERAAQLGVEVVSLQRLMRESDFVSVNCPLTDQTRNLIHRELIDVMKPTAFLINTARGGIVNEEALADALKHKRIAGAATDVYGTEPAGKEHLFTQLDNILLAPHCIAWTDELFCEIGTMACLQAVALSKGEIPAGLVNLDVLDRPAFQAKIERFRRS